MRSQRVCRGCVVFCAAWLCSAGTTRAEVKVPNSNASPRELVQAALRSELDGPNDARQTLLDAALERDPDYAPARWQAGFVRWNNEWLSIDVVPRRSQDDPQRAAYRKQRDALVDTADNQRALAKWCRKNKLTDEARIHWAKVLEFDANDAEALNALGLQLYNGRLLTREQIEQEKHKAGEQLQATRHWQPQIAKWRTAITQGNPKESDAALEKLRELSDPQAILALESIFASPTDHKSSDQLNLLLIETVGRMPVPEAVQVLVRWAILADSQGVRAAAADELKKRPMFAYVPQLIAAIPDRDAETHHEINVLIDGSVIRDHEIVVKDPAGDHYLHFQDVDIPGDIDYRLFKGGVDRRLRDFQRSTRSFEGQLERQRALDRELKERIEAILVKNTPFKQSSDLKGFLAQWENYTESYSPPAYSGPSQSQRFIGQARITCSCFPAGTSIMSIAGPVSIEKLRVGDSVLAQDPQSGELAYKTVQRVTLRPASPLLKIGFGSEAVSATRGHPFWVNGKGWSMAKQLTIGDVLHTLSGAAVVDSCEELPAREAYNLVVSDFGTYFVGNRRILVHDNLPLQETTALVPGLEPDATTPANDARDVLTEAASSTESK
jgi:hypothetical protein